MPPLTCGEEPLLALKAAPVPERAMGGCRGLVAERPAGRKDVCKRPRDIKVRCICDAFTDLWRH